MLRIVLSTIRVRCSLHFPSSYSHNLQSSVPERSLPLRGGRLSDFLWAYPKAIKLQLYSIGRDNDFQKAASELRKQPESHEAL